MQIKFVKDGFSMILYYNTKLAKNRQIWSNTTICWIQNNYLNTHGFDILTILFFKFDWIRLVLTIKLWVENWRYFISTIVWLSFFSKPVHPERDWRTWGWGLTWGSRVRRLWKIRRFGRRRLGEPWECRLDKDCGTGCAIRLQKILVRIRD